MAIYAIMKIINYKYCGIKMRELKKQMLDTMVPLLMQLSVNM